MLDYSISFLISPLIISLIAIGLIVLSVLSYRNIRNEISIGRRRLLSFLRSTSFVLMLLVLSGPLISTISTVTEEPQIAFYIDNSNSMVLDRNGSFDSGKYDEYKKVVGDLTSVLNDDDVLLTFSSEVYENELDSILQLPEGKYTNIDKVISDSREYFSSDNVRAAVLLSDGNINQGYNPLIAASKSRIPYYVVGFGDTTKVTDIFINRFQVDRQTAKNTTVNITAGIQWEGIDNSSTIVKLYKDSTLIDSRTISFDKKSGSRTFDFVDLALEEGVYNYKIVVDSLDNESSTLNNQSIALNNVKAINKQISIFSGAPSSDVSFIYNELRDIPDTEISRFIQKDGQEFYVEPTDKSLSETDALVLINFPIKSTPNHVIDKLASMHEKGIPMLFVNGSIVDWNRAKPIMKYMPFDIVQSSGREYEVQLKPIESTLSNTIFSLGNEFINYQVWEDLPPLYRTETYVKPKPGAKVISNSQVAGRDMKDALITSYDGGGANVIASMGYGLYNWKLNGYARSSLASNESLDLLDKFITNSIGYLSIKDKSKRLSITTDKSIYSREDIVLIRAEVKDDAMRPLNGATVEVELSSQNQEENRQISLSAIGNGYYSTTIEGLPSGKYNITAKAKYNNVDIGNDYNGFSISDIDIEKIATNMNERLLRDLAENSGGKFYYIPEIDEIRNDVEKNSSFKSRSSEVRQDLKIWDMLWPLIIVIVLLSIEWSMRKKWGLL